MLQIIKTDKQLIFVHAIATIEDIEDVLKCFGIIDTVYRKEKQT